MRLLYKIICANFAPHCYNKDMKVEVFALPDCPYGEPAVENVRKALAVENIEVDVSFERISEQEGLSKGLSGSPSVVINGKELQPSGSPVFN
jgi:glutaredoxin